MAMKSVAPFYVLLAFASGHLSLGDESYKVTALETRSKAIRSLATAINTPSDQVAHHETNAAACVSFVIYEAGVGDCKAWYTHLKGTQNIIKSTSVYASGKLPSGPEAFKHSTEGQAPLLPGDYLDGITEEVDSSTSVAAGLLRIIACIEFLAEKTLIKERTLDDEAQEKLRQLQTSYAEIEQELLNWHCHPDASSELAALPYAYRAAALIVLYQLVHNHIKSSHDLPFQLVEEESGVPWAGEEKNGCPEEWERGHLVGCAAALEVQRIIREENLVENVREQGALLGELLHKYLDDHPHVGNIEFVADKEAKEPFSPSAGIANIVHTKGLDGFCISLYPGTGTENGVDGDHVLLSPAYATTREEVEEIALKVKETVFQVFEGLKSTGS
ncbi:hypothetical protein GGI43DRAFT_430679 [Trichoderma evansii]